MSRNKTPSWHLSQNSEWIFLVRGANQNAQKLLFTDLLNTYGRYTFTGTLRWEVSRYISYSITTCMYQPWRGWFWYLSNEKVIFFNPNIHIQILQTDLHTCPLRISWENLIKDQGIFSMMIILLILITLSLDSVWILLGENCCWSLLGLKGLRDAIQWGFV